MAYERHRPDGELGALVYDFGKAAFLEAWEKRVGCDEMSGITKRTAEHHYDRWFARTY